MRISPHTTANMTKRLETVLVRMWKNENLAQKIVKYGNLVILLHLAKGDIRQD